MEKERQSAADEKLAFEDFKKMINRYNSEIKAGKAGKGPARSTAGNPPNREDIKNQSKWVWFDRDTLEKLLALTDRNDGGIKMYFCQYDEETAPPKNPNKYIGRLTLALVASNKVGDEIVDIKPSPVQKSLVIPHVLDKSDSLENAGQLCPPNCNSDPCSDLTDLDNCPE